MALGMNNFDAIVFLQQFNAGHAMTIKEMAQAFYVVDEKKAGDGDDKIATIVCHNSLGTQVFKGGIVGQDKHSVCNKPEFNIKR